MRSIVSAALLLTFVTLGLAPRIQPDEPDLGFLAGHWRGELAGAVMEEHWFPPAHGSTTGMLRWFDSSGRVRMLELMTISPDADGRLTYRMRHFDGEMTPWESETGGPLVGEVVERGAGRMVVRATARAGDLESMTYEALEGGLRVTLRFAQESQREPLVITFQAVR